MRTSNWKSPFVAACLLSCSLLAPMARAGSGNPISDIDGSYNLDPSIVNQPLPVTFSMVDGSVTGGSVSGGGTFPLTGWSASTLDASISATMQVTLLNTSNVAQLTISSGANTIVYDIGSPAEKNNTTITADLLLVSNSTSPPINLTNLNSALLTLTFHNATLDPKWPLNPEGGKAYVTFGITPLSAVPEPSPLVHVLWAATIGGLIHWRRKRRATLAAV